MEKLVLIKYLLDVVRAILKDTDKDGRPDMFDSEPENPEVK